MCNDADEYRRYWSALTDRSEREVYVPEALRPDPEPTVPIFVQSGGHTIRVDLADAHVTPGPDGRGQFVSGTVVGTETVR